MNLDQALLIFIAECRELLEDMESSLLALEQTDDKTELINSIFRAASKAPAACSVWTTWWPLPTL